MQKPSKYNMFLAILTTLTALTISAVAIYYSIAGLVAIFAAAAVPIMIMGGALEVGKLVTAVWLHKHWKRATWWLKSYLTIAVVVLMFITSMGIFGFLSKAHIEQTSASEESVAQVQQIETEIGRLNGIIARADEKIKALETSGTGADANIQAQIDKEQERIDKAFDRIKPAIDQQNKIIEDARATDGNRTKPYEDQLTNIQAEILRLETSAKEYETKIENLDADTSVTQPLLDNIKEIEEEIIRVTNQINSKEDSQVKAAQAIIGVTSDGLFGGNTRRALASWVEAQRDRIKELNLEISELRQGASEDVDKEKVRLAEIIKDIRTVQIPALKDRELKMLEKIDDVRKDESPVIQTARDEIQRLRESAEKQVENSQALIERLQKQLAQTDKADEIDAAVDEQLLKIKTAETELDSLTEEKYALQAEYRKLEAEVGPIKYIAEFVYGEQADKGILEEAVRWVILIIIFVFDPLAVLLLIASQYTFEWARKKDDDFDFTSYERKRAEKIVANPGPEPEAQESTEDETINDTTEPEEGIESNSEEEKTTHEMLMEGFEEEQKQRELEEAEEVEVEEPKKKEQESSVESKNDLEAWNEWVEAANKAAEEEKTSDDSSMLFGKDNIAKNDIQKRADKLALMEEDTEMSEAKRLWKAEHPDQNIKDWKQAYVTGRIHKLPWEDFKNELRAKPDLTEVIEPEGYKQNEEQSEQSIWNRIKRDSE